MPRNSSSKYVRAYDAIIAAAEFLNIDPAEISKTIVAAINSNRIRMRGKLVHSHEHSFNGALAYIAELKRQKTKAIPRNWMKSNFQVKTMMHGHVIKRPFLCSEDSHIQLRPLNAKEYTISLAKAELLRYDLHRVLHDAYSYSAPETSLGVSRSDRTWGAVVYHLITLERRNALRGFKTPALLIRNVLDAVPDTNEASIRSVLVYLVRLLEAEKPD
jgi:hypothetical protein